MIRSDEDLTAMLSFEVSVMRDQWRKATDPRYVPGIYNYCDRWCERCRATHLCFLYDSERQRRAEHLSEGRNPDDWDVVMEDVKQNFEDALEMLSEMAAEQGIELNAITDETMENVLSEENDDDDHPLVVDAMNYTRATSEFLVRMRTELEGEVEEAIELFEILPEEALVEKLRTLRDSYETIAWYHMLISVKIRRAIGGLRDGALLGELEEIPCANDATGSAKVASESLVKSMAAYKKVYDLIPDFRDEILNLLLMAKRLSDAVDRSFPGHKEFHRPGLDGPYVPEDQDLECICEE